MKEDEKVIDLIKKFADINDFSEIEILENAKGRSLIFITDMINELNQLPAIPYVLIRLEFWKSVRSKTDACSTLPDDTFEYD